MLPNQKVMLTKLATERNT